MTNNHIKRGILITVFLIAIVGQFIYPPIVQADNSPCNSEQENPVCDDGNSFNGYWWYGYWVDGLASCDTQFLPLPPRTSGKVVYYNAGVMEATAEYRGLSLDGYVDGIAVSSCAMIGRSAWLRRPGEAWEGPFLVSDCSRRNDIIGHIFYIGQVAEVGYRTAVRWGMTDANETMLQGGIEDVELSFIDPFDFGMIFRSGEYRTVQPADLKTYYAENLTFDNSGINHNCTANYRIGENGLPEWKMYESPEEWTSFFRGPRSVTYLWPGYIDDRLFQPNVLICTEEAQ